MAQKLAPEANVPFRFEFVVSLVLVLGLFFQGPAHARESKKDEQRTPRHVIVMYDVSKSMKKDMKAQDMERIQDYLLTILFDHIPSRVKSPDNIKTKLSKDSGLDPEQPLYRDGDILTFLTFADKITHVYQRHRQFVSRNTLEGKLPRKYPGDTTPIGYATVAVCNNLQDDDGETYFLSVSDWVEEDKRKIPIEELDLCKKNYYFVPMYSLQVKNRVYVKVEEVRPVDVDRKGNGKGPFLILAPGMTDTTSQDLVFAESVTPGKSELKAGYKLVKNPALRRPLEVTGVQWLVRHVKSDAPDQSEPIFKGRQAPPLDLSAFSIESRFLSPDYRVAFEVAYQADTPGESQTVWRSRDLPLIPDVKNPFRLLGQDFNALDGPLTFTGKEGSFEPRHLLLQLKQGIQPTSVKINSISWSDESGIGDVKMHEWPPKDFPVKIVLTLSRPSAARPGQLVKGRLMVFYSIAGLEKGRVLQEIPLDLLVKSSALSPDDLFVKSGEKDRVTQLSFTWTPDFTLWLTDCALGWKSQVAGQGYVLEKARLMTGQKILWERALSVSEAAAPIELVFDKKTSAAMWKEGIVKGLIDIQYRMPDSVATQSVSLPLTMLVPDPPAEKLFGLVAEGSDRQPIKEIRLTRDSKGDLVLEKFLLVANKELPADIPTKLESAEVEVGNLTLPLGGGIPLKIRGTFTADQLGAGLHEGRISLMYTFGRLDRKLTQVIPFTLIVPDLPELNPFVLLSDPNKSVPPKQPLALRKHANTLEMKGLLYLKVKGDVAPQLKSVELVTAEIAGLLPVVIAENADPGNPIAIDARFPCDQSDQRQWENKKLQGRVVVRYLRAGVEKVIQQELPFSATVPQGFPQWLLVAIVVLAVVAGGAYLGLKRVCRKGPASVTFALISTDEFAGDQTEHFALNRDEKLALDKQEATLQHSNLVDSPGSYIIYKGKKGLQLYSNETSAEAPVRDWEDCSVRSRDGSLIRLRITLESQEKSPKDPSQSKDDSSAGSSTGTEAKEPDW